MLLKVFSFCLAIYFIQPFGAKACNVYRTEDDDDESGSRRKRQAAPNSRNIVNTRFLREYFTACLNTLVPEASPDWRSNVDYSVLDTSWFEDNAMVNCGFGFGKTDCWKRNLVTFVKYNAEVRSSIDRCITYYADDFLQEPPVLDRFSLTGSSRRKRQTTSNQTIDSYSSCLAASTMEMTDLRKPLNFESLSDFAENYLVNRSCFSGFATSFSQEESASWPRYIVTFTRLDSPLRESFQTCGERVFPMEFPIRYNGPTANDFVGFWGEWESWSSCSTTCGLGTRQRERSCFIAGQDNAIAEPVLCGCEEEDGDCTTQTESCNSLECVLPSWSSWIQLNTCTRTCGRGVTVSIRHCFRTRTERISFRECEGTHTQIRSCNIPPCPPVVYSNDWSSWTFCPRQCDRGFQTRKRCRNGISSCLSPQVERRNCSRLSCQRRAYK